ncbi:MAG: M48 family metallopeptidase [Gammaproteobacteria bacterium]|nr:M48 family metallopeptidase [Gammaproteobacteria bacterium]
MNEFTYVFLCFLGASLILQYWLASRQYQHVLKHRSQVPDAFKDKIGLDEHQKAADYTFAKIKLGRVDLLVSAVLLLGWTIGGGLELLDQYWRGLELSSIQTGIGVMISAMLIMSTLDLPLSAYSTFVIEKRFDFNKTTVKLFIIDLIKGATLTLVIGTPLLWVVLWIMEISGPLWWLYVWAVWFSFGLIMMWAYPAFIAPLFNKFNPLENEELKTRIENLMKKCGFISNGIFVMDGSRRSSHGNAYFTGLGNNKRIVFYDTLIESLEDEEVEAVLAHELGHFRLNHIRKRMIGMAIMSLAALALLGWLIQQLWFFTGMGTSTQSNYMALMLFMMVQPVFGFFLTPIMAGLSRKHEFQADAYAASHKDASILVRALVKLYKENANTLTPDPVYSNFYDSHPPAPVRIAHLQQQPQPT